MEGHIKPLTGQVAIVTGSRIGIGRAIAKSLLGAGASVVLNGSSDQGTEELLSEFKSISPHVCYARADISNKSDVKKLVSFALREFGPADILVNNAGVAWGGLLFDFSEEVWQRIFNINLLGALYCTQEVLPMMRRRRRGNILNMSSTAGFDLPPLTGAYSITKACLCGFTRVLAKEEAPYGIRVNAVAPSYILTSLSTQENPEKDLKFQQKLLARTPLGRLATPEDVAQAALFLLSERGRYITGEVLRVSGGHQMPL